MSSSFMIYLENCEIAPIIVGASFDKDANV
jgi:hypothetical protein